MPVLTTSVRGRCARPLTSLRTSGGGGGGGPGPRPPGAPRGLPRAEQLRLRVPGREGACAPPRLGCCRFPGTRGEHTTLPAFRYV